MTLCDEIRNCFSFLDSVNTDNKIIPIDSLPSEYSAFAIRDKDGFAVAIPFDRNVEFLENYHGATLEVVTNNINGISANLLKLSTLRISLRNEFAVICAEFITPGENGELRKELLNNPKGWWEKWKELFGNSISEKKTYSVIAELLILSKMYENDKTLVWAGPDAGSHDIEGYNCSYEVKSSIKRYGIEVAIAGQFQLKKNKPLFLIYCKMEKSKEGISINDMVKKLSSQGFNRDDLLIKITKLGIINTSERNKKYKIHEIRKFVVDDNFPQITDKSFVAGKTPDRIKQVQYTIELNDYPCEVIKI